MLTGSWSMAENMLVTHWQFQKLHASWFCVLPIPAWLLQPTSHTTWWSCLSQLVHKVGIVFPYRHWHGRQEWKVVIIIHYPLGGGVSYKHNAIASTSRHTVPLKVWTEPPFDCYSTLIFQKSVQFPHIKYCTFVLFLFCFNNNFSIYSLYKLCNSNRSK